MPWSLLLENMLSQEYIDILWDELNNTDFYFLKKKMILGAILSSVTNSNSADVAILVGKRRPLRGDPVTRCGVGGAHNGTRGEGARRSGRLITDIAIDSQR